MKPFEQQNYYELLEVPVSAPPEEIRAAYSRLMELYAPDSIAVYALVDPDQVDSLRARMTEAMEILTDADLRAEYDKDLGVPGQAATKPAEPGAVARAAEALASAVEAVSSPVQKNARPEPVASVKPEEGRGVEPVAAPAVEPAPAAVPRNSFRTSIFRGVSFTYVTSSLQDAGAVGSAVDVPVSTVRAASPQATGAEAPVAESAQPSASPVESVPAPVHVTESPASATAQTAAGSSTAPVEASAQPAGTSAQLASAAPAEAPAQSSAPAQVSADPSAGAAAQSSAEPPAVATPPQEPRSSAPARAQGAPATRSAPPPLPSSRAGRAASAAESSGTPPEAGRPSQRPSSGKQLADAQVIAQESAIATAESALAQVAARVREPPPPPQQPQRARIPDIPADAEFNGELLRRVREARGHSLQQVADRTRISSRHLENVEADRYNALPAPVYLRGILMNLARELGLDPLRVSRSYLALASQKTGGK